MRKKTFYCGLVFSIFFSVEVAQAQSTSLIEAAHLERSDLDPEQGSRFDRIVSSDDVLNPLIVRIRNLASTQLNGKISITIPRARCQNSIFTGREVRYTSEDDYYWYGEIMNADSTSCPEGSLTLMATNGERFGILKLDTIVYEVHDLSHGVQLVVQQKTEEFDYEESPPDPVIPDGISINPGCLGSCFTRILVLYTPRAAAATGNINNVAHLGVIQTHQAFLNSAIPFDIAHPVFVAAVPFNFRESLVAKTDVHRLATDPTARALRTQYQADIVVLLTNGLYLSVGGIVEAVGPSSDKAYAIVQVRHALKNYVFAHEVAHLFGARHNTDPVATYERAYQFNAGFLKEKRTIMWPVASNKNIQYYSNPNVLYKNKATGTSTNDNARKIRETGCIVGNFIPNPLPPFSAEIQGYHVVYPCQASSTYVMANVNCGTPPYTYEWRFSYDGINWGPVDGTEQSYRVDGDCYHTVFVQLVARDAAGHVATDVFAIYWDYGQSSPSTQRPAQEQLLPSATISPNPVTNELRLNYTLESKQEVAVQLVNINGQVVANIPAMTVLPGAHKLSLNVAGLPGGVYLLKFQNKSGIVAYKVVISR